MDLACNDGFQVLGNGFQVPAVAERGPRRGDAPGLDEELVEAAFGERLVEREVDAVGPARSYDSRSHAQKDQRCFSTSCFLSRHS